MKDNNVKDWPLADAAVLDLREAQILRKIGRKRRKKGNRIARALALLWPQHEHHDRLKSNSQHACCDKIERRETDRA